MKKLFVPLLILSVSFTSIEAKNLITNNITTNVYSEISTFCKLIREGNYIAVKAMIESGENVNKKSNGLTPLMFAARYNRADIAQLLIDNGAKIDTKSNRGNTALKWAKMTKANDVVAIIQKTLQK